FEFVSPSEYAGSVPLLIILAVIAGAAVTVDNGSALGSGGGTQDSRLLKACVVASGSAFANAESYEEGWDAAAYGYSELIYDFTLTEAATYSITGEISAFDSSFTVTGLQDANGTITSVAAFGPAETLPVDRSGVLGPGDYRFLIQAEATTFSTTFDFDFGFGEYAS
ncbi:MAG: hypothetical protein AAF391_02500, partial [Bacteroidota bacterium]